MVVASTYNQVISFLSSKRYNSDRIIEEYIEGLQFGTEIHGTNGKYIVHNPYLFSVNKYGITSPKQSVKIGPVCDKKYKIPSGNKRYCGIKFLCHGSCNYK